MHKGGTSVNTQVEPKKSKKKLLRSIGSTHIMIAVYKKPSTLYSELTIWREGPPADSEIKTG
jgi:hypothetical protein